MSVMTNLGSAVKVKKWKFSPAEQVHKKSQLINMYG